MRMKLLKLIAVTGFFFFFTNTSKSQNCIPTNIGGAVINLACNQVCSTFTFRIPHLKSSTDYTLVNVPYTPYPYNTPTGTEDPTMYADDTYSLFVNLPFTFCFTEVFTTIVAGSNGIITFDPANAVLCKFMANQSQPIPYCK
ncbi:MAG: hypothetical protein IPP02_07880 [Chitinophagaceae bacterium]|nr:hypothetical protein [Chitinophagaceae bacterium]